MKTVYVKLFADLHCDWEGYPPNYRLYVDDEMLVERTYKWNNPEYLTEILPLLIEQKKVHTVRLEPVAPQLATFRFEQPRIGKCDHQVQISQESDTEFTFKVLK